MSFTRKLGRLGIVSLVSAGLMAGWLMADGTSGTTKAAQPESVTYLLPAPPFLPAFGPWMVAKARGYYADEGLDVTFQMARGGVDVAKQVGAGNAVIGGAIGDTPIVVRANGIPVKAVAVLGGRSLTQIAVPAESNIKAPADLEGKTVTTLSYQDTTFYALLGALADAGLNKSDLDIQAAGAASVWKLFAAGEVDAMAAVPDWIAQAESEGMNVRILPVDRYFKSMAQAIVASDETIEGRPELIGKLVRATLEGLRDIMEDPAGAASDYVEAVPQHQGKEALITKTFELYNEYVYPGQDVLGAMDPARLEAVQKFYYDRGIIRSKTDLGALYTNRFVE